MYSVSPASTTRSITSATNSTTVRTSMPIIAVRSSPETPSTDPASAMRSEAVAAEAVAIETVETERTPASLMQRVFRYFRENSLSTMAVSGTIGVLGIGIYAGYLASTSTATSTQNQAIEKKAQ